MTELTTIGMTPIQKAVIDQVANTGVSPDPRFVNMDDVFDQIRIKRPDILLQAVRISADQVLNSLPCPTAEIVNPLTAFMNSLVNGMSIYGVYQEKVSEGMNLIGQMVVWLVHHRKAVSKTKSGRAQCADLVSTTRTGVEALVSMHAKCLNSEGRE